jgi:hypothetical protein
MVDTPEAVQRWRRGQLAAEQRQRELMMREGPRPKQAIAEALSALHALASMGKWPGPRDPVAESEVARVRERWTRIGKRARAAAKTLGR